MQRFLVPAATSVDRGREHRARFHGGGICTNGIFCSLNDGNRHLADSISIAIDRGGSAALARTDQGRVLHGPTHITYGCNTSRQSAYAGANQGLSCKGPAQK